MLTEGTLDALRLVATNGHVSGGKHLDKELFPPRFVSCGAPYIVSFAGGYSSLIKTHTSRRVSSGWLSYVSWQTVM